ncbi:MAG: hypothetical protein OEX12_06770 [Gammaproteobacteria bacterium]|nr:hypothetical protein [Gammaproteobacteria bacterium]
MKFHQLHTGDTFIYNDKKHIKLNNVMAQDVDSKKQIFMKRSDIVSVTDASTTKPAVQSRTYEKILDGALIDFQAACIKQYRSCQNGVSPDVAEAEINRIREEILHHYMQKI